MKTDDDNVPDQKIQFSDYDDADDDDDDDVDALSSQWLWYQMSIYFTFMISQTLGLCAPYVATFNKIDSGWLRSLAKYQICKPKDQLYLILKHFSSNLKAFQYGQFG